MRRRALSAARADADNIEDLNAERTAAGERPLAFGIALYVGDVMYGISARRNGSTSP
jgi:hypothetical protein